MSKYQKQLENLERINTVSIRTDLDFQVNLTALILFNTNKFSTPTKVSIIKNLIQHETEVLISEDAEFKELVESVRERLLALENKKI